MIIEILPSMVRSVIFVVSFSRSGLSPLFPAVCGFFGSSTAKGGGSCNREMAENKITMSVGFKLSTTLVWLR